MLERQILKDTQGIPMGVFIPMQTWEYLVLQYPEIETLEEEVPQWERDFIDKRLFLAQSQPERLKPIKNLFDIL